MVESVLGEGRGGVMGWVQGLLSLSWRFWTGMRAPAEDSSARRRAWECGCWEM